MSPRVVFLDHTGRTGLSLCTKQNFKNFSAAKVFFRTQNFKFENFIQREWSEEKLLEGSVGHQTRLCFWNKCQMTDPFLMQLASYRHILAREFKYHVQVQKHFIYLSNFLVLIVDTLDLFHAFNCTAPAAWLQGPSFSVCFQSVASFCHPQYLSRTSPLSIHCA